MKVRVETYGCTMNQGEGTALAEKLASLGHEVVTETAEAEMVVLNTCTVIRETENRMLRRMNELSAQRKKLVVVGCMASVQPDEIVKHAPDALIMAPRDYSHFDTLVENNFGRGSAALMVLPSPVSAVLPIAQGCLGACSYCITKQARGSLSSYQPDGIISSAKTAVENGARELLLTAQDTACYGFDLGIDLSDLLTPLTAFPGDFMIRVGMMNPDNLGRIIEQFVPKWATQKVYQFIHLPVQSGSAAVLEGMNRGYRPEHFVSLVRALREASPSMTLSTDVITGFPGETEEDHRATVNLLEQVKPDIINVTRFSPRQGTPAAKARKQVPGWVSKERSRELTKVRFGISGVKNAKFLGKRERIVVTEHGKNSTSMGRTLAYRPVIVPQNRQLGTVLEVEIIDSAPTHLFGQVL